MSLLRIASWNINSVRIRLPLIQRFCQQIKPDVLCLQETKVEDALFPADALRQMGFVHQAISGQKSYNGMAILSRLPLSDIRTESFLRDEKRHLCAQVNGRLQLHNVYVPAGGDIPDPDANPKFADKLSFMDQLSRWCKKTLSKNAPVVLLGDLNIAPLEHDVWSHKQLLGVVSHTPVEVQKFSEAMRSIGWVDAARQFVPSDEKLYSWWSYRNRDWAKSNRGRRLDHVWITPALHPSLQSATILREARGWENPSDHVPVVVELAA